MNTVFIPFLRLSDSTKYDSSDMSKAFSPDIPYSALHKSKCETRLQSGKTWVMNAFQSFTKPVVYTKVNLGMCLILTAHYFIFAFLHNYNTCYALVFEAGLCLMLLIDIFANTLEYLLSIPYYYDMALFTYDMVTAILIIMAEGWGVRLPASWFRIHFLAQDGKYIIPTAKWLMERYAATEKRSAFSVQANQTCSTDPYGCFLSQNGVRVHLQQTQ